MASSGGKLSCRMSVGLLTRCSRLNPNTLVIVMIANERRGQLLELVRQRGFASLGDLTSEMGVSESTIRRDLDYLEENGSAKRTHGGVFYTGPSPQLPHFQCRHEMQLDKKHQIADCAAELIEDGDVVLLDGGSTTYELAQRLVHRQIQVVTNSLPVANLFTSSESTDLIFIGGYIHLRTGVSLGPYANEMLTTLNVRRAVLSVAGVSERGYFNSNLLLVETERAMTACADETIILAVSTKFGRQSLARLCGLGEVDAVVVDTEISDQWKENITSAGVTLHIGKTAFGG